MGGVADDEGTAIAKFVGNQPASIPVFLRDDLVVETVFHAEDGPQAGIAIDLVEIALTRPHVVVHQPALTAVDRIDHARAARIDRTGAPGGRALLAIDQPGRADVRRLHALDHGIAGQFRTHRLANDRARAVATDQIAAVHPRDGARVQSAPTGAPARLPAHPRP